jgi:DNA-binding CsgD family transcriptional regulator
MRGVGALGSSSSAIVGREAELGAISAFLGALPSGPRALVLEGSAGIGKTTLWQAGVDEARAAGHTVLVTRAAESEARLSYAALGDLLADVPDATFDDLPTPLRGALDRALLRGDQIGGAPDPRAVALAVASLLQTLAEAAPIVIAIDDVQWLDRPSARVLSFVFRRLTTGPMGVLESLRLGSAAPSDPIETDRAFAACEHVPVGPLTVGALGRILRERSDQAMPRPYVVRLHEVTGGNPLFALAIARTAADQRRADPGEPWPVPEDIQRVLSARLAQVPPPAGPALLAIAATSQPTWELVLRASGSDGSSLAALGRAEALGIIERVDQRVRFTHPLLASTVYLHATEDDRRRVHTRLAELLDDPEEHARHLALGTDGPDAGVATALDEAAQHARTRGAPDAAAELALIASSMTPATDESALRERRLAAAEYLFDAGDAQRAQQLLREAIAASPPSPERAKMLYRLASMSWMNLIDGVRAPSIAALQDAGDDPALRTGIHNALAWVAIYLADLDEAERQARECERWASLGVDDGPRADAISTLEIVSFLQGRPDPRLMAEAIKLQDDYMAGASWTEGSVYTTPRSMLALELMWSGRLDEARPILLREVELYERLAMYALRQEVLCYLAEVECRAGNWLLAEAYAAESMEIIEESGQSATQRQVVSFNQAWPAALLGKVEEARRIATTGVDSALANDDRFNGAWNQAVLGFLDLSLQDFEGARGHLEAAVGWLDALGSVESAVIPCVPDLVEALVALGRLDDAEGLVDRLEAQAAGRDRPWATGTAARGRALLAAARGDLTSAADAGERSITELERTPQPFEAARSWLVLGQVHRRAKQKRLAREALGHARAAFVELGAKLWIERADGELRRIGGRTPSPFELTETEASIASLVARGLTNHEAADALFLSPATVQASLKRVYQKLGVRSRTELAATLGRSPEG